MGQHGRGQGRGPVLVVVLGAVPGHVPVGDVPVGPLEFEERQQRLAEALRLMDLERLLDERVEIANPDLAITAARREIVFEHLPRHLMHIVKASISEDLPRDGRLVRRRVAPATAARTLARRPVVRMRCVVQSLFMKRVATIVMPEPPLNFISPTTSTISTWRIPASVSSSSWCS